MAATIRSSEIAPLTTVTINTHECVDGSIGVYSTLSQTHSLPRHNCDKFTLAKDDVLIVKNRSEQEAWIDIEVDRIAGHALIVRSNRRAAVLLKTSDIRSFLLQGGEALTIRGDMAETPDDIKARQAGFARQGLR